MVVDVDLDFEPDISQGQHLGASCFTYKNDESRTTVGAVTVAKSYCSLGAQARTMELCGLE